MHFTDTYAQDSLNMSAVWLIAWVFVHELSVCVSESRGCHLNFRYVPISSNKFLDINQLQRVDSL